MIKLESLLNEALPALIPEYPVNIAGQHLKLRFDVNVNKTKKGIKLQFVLNEVPQDPRALQNLANEIGTELQEKFAAHNLQVVYDVENPYKNVIGFLLPLPSVSNFIMTTVLQGADTEPEQPAPQGEEAPEAPQAPEVPEKKPLPPLQGPDNEEPLRERMKKIAGI
jgi:hypothetical protein